MTLRRLAVVLVAALVPITIAGVYLSQHRTSGDTATSATPSPRPPTPGLVSQDAAGDTTRTEQPTAPERTRIAVGVRYAFPISGCDSTYAATHHHYPAADIFAATGCSFVAPVAGRITFVARTDRWSPATNAGAARGGLAVALLGVDGVQYYGSHLDSVEPGIAPGSRVRAGQRLGGVGETGSAQGTGPHLHFGISWPTNPAYWWIRRGTVAPQPYLDAWRTGHHLSPADGVTAAQRSSPDDSHCGSYC